MTAFVVLGGFYEYLVMLFGLTNAPATCQRQNDAILKDYLGKTVICYLDDILIYSETEEEHEEHVLQVLRALAKVDSRLKLEKCRFSVKKVPFLGFILEPGKMKLDPEKIRAIKEWPTPENVKDVQSFNGFGNFCRVFIKGYSEIAGPLTQLTKKGIPWTWGEPQETAFQTIKKLFAEEPVLAVYDDEAESIVACDASDTASGAVHLQPDKDGKLHPVAYFSAKHSPAEQNYNIYEKELMAIIKALDEWKIYLKGAKHQVIVHSDHENLRTFLSTKSLDNRRLARWAWELASYDIKIKHIPGKENVVADALSRQPGYEGDKTYKQVAILKEDLNKDFVPNVKEINALTRVMLDAGPWDQEVENA